MHIGVVAGLATTRAPVQASALSGHGSDSSNPQGRLDPVTQTS